MNDRELLELAAKACGWDTSHPWNVERLTLDPPVMALCINGVSTGWNPIENDDHALRLAVRFGMNIYTNDRYCIAEIVSDGDEPPIHCKEHCDVETKYAAARRAIVMAAAEIGRAA